MIEHIEILLIQLMTDYGMTSKQIELAINIKNIEKEEIEKSLELINDTLVNKVENITNKFNNIISDYKQN